MLLAACSRHHTEHGKLGMCPSRAAPWFLSVLRPSGGTKTIVKDPLGHTLEVVESDSVEDGKDVHLTLDHTIYRFFLDNARPAILTL